MYKEKISLSFVKKWVCISIIERFSGMAFIKYFLNQKAIIKLITDKSIRKATPLLISEAFVAMILAFGKFNDDSIDRDNNLVV